MLLRELDAQARKEGGAVYMLNGNHETMNISGNFRCKFGPVVWGHFASKRSVCLNCLICDVFMVAGRSDAHMDAMRQDLADSAYTI